ncbi:hypothetical protein QFZ87_000996 [Bacillus sp. SLBN-46]|jgi:hypothetical protein|uniref:hypothetical protein n=1 Tax=Bacillus sp. SLBN-46 TaxID=3042283 RepID=UPI0028600D34|nr:hypothetical protein [Bacillus sp. SLBN-46]MDR6121399.1 hypothetical protein [Bacillus sp. SLBN-46]
MRQLDHIAFKQQRAQQIYREQLNKKKMAQKEKRDVILFVIYIGLGSLALAAYEVLFH